MRADPRGRLRISLAAASNSEYVDAHEYFFTPSSFLLIMEELFFHELINVRAKLLTRSRGCEFLAILGPAKGSERPSAELFCTLKRELSLNVIREQTEAWRQ
jgi:hypothetical protein